MDKQIRELATEILQEFTNCYSKADEDFLVKMIRKYITENAVVLTKEEFENYEHRQNQINVLLLNNELLRKTLAEVRKETAEQFAEMLKSMAYQSTDWSHGEHPMVVEVDYIDEILEEFTEDK